MKKMMLIAGLMAGALMLSGCGGGGGPSTSSHEMTPGEFNTKVQGFWVANHKNGSCFENTKKGTSSKLAVSFGRKTGFALYSKSYSELGCNKEDKNNEFIYHYNYQFMNRLSPTDEKLSTKLPNVFPMEATFVEVEEKKGILDEKPAKGTKYYLTVGLTKEGDLEFAKNKKGNAFSKDPSDKPLTFNVDDNIRFIKQ